MISFSVVICLSVLLFSTSAKPYSAREKAAQDTMESEDFNGKMMLGMKEVEPPQDMDVTDFDIDPNMLIWKAVKDDKQQKYNKPEEDKDALYHPFEFQLPSDPEQPGTFIQPLGHDQVRIYDEPEEDRDYLYHGMFAEKYFPEEPMREKDAQVTADNGRLMYLSPEEDKDGLYHADIIGQQPDQQAPLVNMFPIDRKQVHQEPEIDHDGLYHKH